MSSTTMQASERLVIASDFVAAVREGDWDRADRLLPDLSGSLSDGAWSAVALLHMQRERWSDAADALELVKTRSDQQKLHLRLSKNLAALRTHRPEIYRVIADAAVGQAYQIHPSKGGKPSILMTRPDGGRTLLAGGDDPQAAATTVAAQLKPNAEKGESLALLSIGDGYAFDAIVRASPVLLLGRRQPIFLFEPDPRLILACFLLHDFTGAEGPIEAEHVLWYVGPRWGEQFRLAMNTDRYLPFPKLSVKLGTDPKPMEQILQITLAELGAIDERSKQQIAAHYNALPADHFAMVFAGKSHRAPRVLLTTTRFSTVLQYSTKDAADAFRQIGWEVQILVEPSAHHGLTKVGMRRTIAEFKPDLIFQIDHNRFEHGDLFHPAIPFVNWIQDLLSHLMTPHTGRKITPRDFVLAPSLQRWVDDYAYPARQCLEFRKLTRIPARPTSWTGRGQQVIYVSNWSQTSEQMREELTRESEGKSREVIDAACDRMIATYMAGNSLPTQGDVRRLLVDVMREQEVQAEESLIRQTTTRLFDRLNNQLFRQQGLTWAKRACEDLGLDLQIYGKGWDKHPDFARYARGTVAYGEPLEELTREAGINLVLEPFVCIAHQRVLDAIAAGGFCLMRANPGTQLIHSVIDLLQLAKSDADTTAQLELQLDEEHRELLTQTLTAFDACDVSPGAVDHVATIRRLQRGGFMPESGQILPLLDQTTFESSDQLTQQLTRHSRDDTLRSEISRAQRSFVKQRFSYVAGVKKIVEFIGQRLTDEPKRLERAA